MFLARKYECKFRQDQPPLPRPTDQSTIASWNSRKFLIYEFNQLCVRHDQSLIVILGMLICVAILAYTLFRQWSWILGLLLMFLCLVVIISVVLNLLMRQSVHQHFLTIKNSEKAYLKQLSGLNNKKE